MKKGIEIKYFCELDKSILGSIVDMHFNYWVKFNPALNKAKVEREFREEYAVSRDRIPLGIAIFKGGKIAAFCRLRAVNLKCCPNLAPWISGLYVSPEFRGQGFGKIIVEKICKIAKDLGTKVIYVWTDQAPEFYTKLGFRFMCNVEKNEGGTAMLFCKDL